jgi:hypothetical protein
MRTKFGGYVMPSLWRANKENKYRIVCAVATSALRNCKRIRVVIKKGAIRRDMYTFLNMDGESIRMYEDERIKLVWALRGGPWESEQDRTFMVLPSSTPDAIFDAEMFCDQLVGIIQKIEVVV